MRIILWTLIAVAMTTAPARAELDPAYSAAKDSLDIIRATGGPAAAEQFSRSLVDRSVLVWGNNSPEHASAWSVLAQVLMGQRRLEEALAAADRSVEIIRAVDGDHPLVLGTALSTRGYVRENLADLRGAHQDLEESLRYLDHDGVDPRLRATALSIQAYILFRLDQLDEAEDHSRRSLALRRQYLDPDAPDVAWNLTQLAAIENRRGNYEVARDHQEESFEIRRRVLGPDNWWTLSDEVALGWTEYLLGNYERAEEILLSAVERLETLDPVDAMLAYALENLGVIEFHRGDYPASRRYHERVLGYRREIWGEDTVEYASSLSNLGDIAGAVQDFERARSYYRQGLELLREEFGDDHVSIAHILIALANLDIQAGKVEAALWGLEVVRRMPSAQAGRDLRFDLELLTGEAYQANGQLDSALVHTEAALRIWGADLELPDAEAAMGVLQCAQILLAMGEFETALDDAERVDRSLEQWFASTHPAQAQACEIAARAEMAMGRTASAMEWALRGERARQAYLRTIGTGLSERLLVRASKRELKCRSLTLSLLDELPMDAARIESFELLAASRGILFEEVASRHRHTGQANSPQEDQLWQDLYDLRQQLAHVAFRTLEESDDQGSLDLLVELRQRQENLEEALLDLDPLGSGMGAQQPLSYAELRAALNQDECLVSYFVAGTDEERRYSAFVTRPDLDAPLFVDLGSAELIESALDNWYREVSEGERQPGRSPASALRAYRNSGTTLSRLVWDPLSPLLGTSRSIYLVAEGRLHLLSWAALPTADGEFLIESGPRIHRLLREREVLAHPESQTAERASLLAMGGIDYAGSDISPDSTRGAAPCVTMEELEFGELPASRQEAESITESWQRERGDSATLLWGSQATEAAFAALAGEYSVLHLATHAWYLRPECVPETAEWARLAEESPLLLSGMALAGANERSGSQSGANDGILTAEEICGLDLSGVDLAVLSACSSGAGPVVGGDGVYGLPRAFRIAGVEEVVLSLWPVADRTTQDFMVGLYGRWLQNGASIGEAVHELALSELRTRRAERRSLHPYYWAAFVATGQ